MRIQILFFSLCRGNPVLENFMYVGVVFLQFVKSELDTPYQIRPTK